jgi:hypothetical protein
MSLTEPSLLSRATRRGDSAHLREVMRPIQVFATEKPTSRKAHEVGHSYQFIETLCIADCPERLPLHYSRSGVG